MVCASSCARCRCAGSSESLETDAGSTDVSAHSRPSCVIVAREPGTYSPDEKIQLQDEAAVELAASEAVPVVISACLLAAANTAKEVCSERRGADGATGGRGEDLLCAQVEGLVTGLSHRLDVCEQLKAAAMPGRAPQAASTASAAPSPSPTPTSVSAALSKPKKLTEVRSGISVRDQVAVHGRRPM
jgi:hypothetical protein